MTSLEELWRRHDGGERLSPAEEQILAEAIRAQPAFRAACLEDLALRGLLQEALLARSGDSDFAARVGERLRADDTASDFVAAVRRELPGSGRTARLPRGGHRPRRRTVRRPALRRGLLVAALGFLLVVGLLPFLRSRPSGEPIVVERVNGRVLVEMGARSWPLSATSVLLPGCRLECAANGTVRVRIGASSCDLDPGSAATIHWDAADGARIELERGRIGCEVAPQEGQRRFRVHTLGAECSVLGTRFAVTYHAAVTRLSVSEGRVACRATGSGAELTVLADQVVEVAADGSLALVTEAPPPLAWWDCTAPGADGSLVERGGDPTLDLRPEDPEALRFDVDGLHLLRPTRLVSRAPAAGLLQRIAASGAFSIALTVTPAAVDLGYDTRAIGPGRILTWSRDALARNLTMGQGPLHQEVGRYAVRVRRGGHDNGLPALVPPGRVRLVRTRLVLVGEADGGCRLYRDGALVASDARDLDFAQWDAAMHLAIGGELGVDDGTGQRPWLGTIHALRIWDRALSATEIAAVE